MLGGALISDLQQPAARPWTPTLLLHILLPSLQTWIFDQPQQVSFRIEIAGQVCKLTRFASMPALPVTSVSLRTLSSKWWYGGQH